MTAVKKTAKTLKPLQMAESEPQYGGTLRIANTYVPPPRMGVPGRVNVGGPWVEPIVDKMLRVNKAGQLVPHLVESWKYAEDGLHLTLHARKGVKFHDGTDFNAKVVVWNLQKYKEGGYLVTSRYIKSTDILDDYTLRLNLTQWRNTLLGAFNMSPLVSEAAYEKNGEDWARWNMVGTGPFKQSDFNRDVSLTAVKFDNYWQTGKPYLSQVKYLNVVDESTRMALLRSGTGDITDLNKSGKAAIALQNEGYKIITQPVGILSLIPDSVNADSAWSNIKVRQAAEYAIDKDAIAKAFGFGFTTAAYQVYPEGYWGYNPAITQHKYDPAKAKQLLTEAGYANGFKSTIISDNTINKDIATAIQSYFDAVGIKVELDFPAAARFTDYSMGTWNNALLFTTLRAGAQPTQVLTFTAEPRTQYKSNKNPDNWMDTYNKMMTTPALDQKIYLDGLKAQADSEMLVPVIYAVDIMEVSPKLQDHSIGTLQNAVTWNVNGAWLSK